MFKKAICGGLYNAVTFGGVALFGAFAALCGHRIGKEEGKCEAYADCSDRLSHIVEKHKNDESEKEES